MICVVPSNCPMEAAFYSVYSEAETLILFSRYFPLCKDDLFLFRVDDDLRSLRGASPYKLVKYKQLQKIINRANGCAAE